MKKIALILGFVFVILLVGCTKEDADPNITEIDENAPSITLDDTDTFAFSTYLASSLLDLSTDSSVNMTYNPSSFNLQLLTMGDESETVETDLDEINIYFDKLKIFMDQGVDSTLQISEETSTREDYDQQITYSIEDVSYTIYFSYVPIDDSVTEEDNTELDQYEIVGLIIINDVEYELEGMNKIENDENIIWFKTIDKDNTNNYIKVLIKDEDGKQMFHIDSEIDGVLNKTKIKLIEEDNETKVQLMIKGDAEDKFYLFKKEIVEEGTIYKLNYRIDNEHGVVIIKETVDDEGNISYIYKINEGKKTREITKNKPINRYRHRENTGDTA